MRTLTPVLSVALMCLVMAGQVVAEETIKGTPLSGADLKALIDSGVILDYTGAGNTTRGTVALLRFGPAYVIWMTAGGTAGSDQGKWRIEDDKLCLQWNFIHGAQDYCVRYYRTGEDRYESRRVPDGTLANTLTRRN